MAFVSGLEQAAAMQRVAETEDNKDKFTVDTYDPDRPGDVSDFIARSAAAEAKQRRVALPPRSKEQIRTDMVEHAAKYGRALVVLTVRPPASTGELLSRLEQMNPHTLWPKV